MNSQDSVAPSATAARYGAAFRTFGQSLALFSFGIGATPALANNPVAGEVIYRQRCQSCHTSQAGAPGRIGPNLSRVMGRKAGTAAFRYSPALSRSGVTWTPQTLDAFLKSPTRMVPGTRMVVSLANDEQRRNIIAYLATLR